MKILQLSASYKPAYIYGGPTMSVSMLSEQLVAAGHKVTVYTTTANGLTELPVAVGHPVTVDRVKVTYFKRLTKDHTHLSPPLLKYLWRTVRDYDVVHIHAWWNLVSLLGCIVALAHRVPVVVSPRGTLSNYTFHNKNSLVKYLIHSWIGKPLLKRCVIHTTAKNEQQLLQTMLPGNIVFNLPNFIKLTDKRFGGYQQSEQLKLIFLSRIEKKKGLDILINALKDVFIPYHLTIAGDGNKNYVDELKELAYNNGVSAHISWIGFQTDLKYQLLYDHDVMILPSFDENFGNVVIESLSVGTAVLISGAVGLADYVEQYRLGWVCETNSQSVSKFIHYLDTQRAAIEQIKHYAPEKISGDFNYTNLTKRYVDMYKQVVK